MVGTACDCPACESEIIIPDPSGLEQENDRIEKTPSTSRRRSLDLERAESTPSRRGPKPTAISLFLAVFLAIVLGGACLLLGWKYFLAGAVAGTIAPSQARISKPLAEDEGSESKPKTSTSLAQSVSRSVEAMKAVFERKGLLEGEVFIVTKGGENYKLGLVPVALYPLDTIKRYIDERTQERDKELSPLNPQVEAAEAEVQRADAEETSAMNSEEGPEVKAAEAEVLRSQVEVLRADAAEVQRVEAAETSAEKSENTDAFSRAEANWEKAEKILSPLSQRRAALLSGNFYFHNLPKPLAITQTDSDGKFKIEIPVEGEFVVAATSQRSVGDSEEHYYWLLRVSLDGASSKSIMLSNNNLSSQGSPDSLILTEN